MSILDRIKKTESKAPRILLYGEPGIGKTTLASQFPSPLFLCTEDVGLPNLDCIGIKSLEEMREVLEGLFSLSEIPYKTIVLDSLSKLDDIIVKNITSSETQSTGKKIATLASSCGGYGAGYERAATLHKWVRDMLYRFQERGITVITIAHMTQKTYKSPESHDYDYFTITANHDKTRDVYINDSDAVLFCRDKQVVDEVDDGKHIVKSLKQKIVMTTSNPVNVSKNRFNMPDEIPMSFDAIKKYIKFYE